MTGFSRTFSCNVFTMKINQPLLAAALSKCAHITKSSHGLPILSTVRMEARSGRLSLWATDLNQFSIQHVDCDGELEPACVGVGRAAIRPSTRDARLSGRARRSPGVGDAVACASERAISSA